MTAYSTRHIPFQLRNAPMALRIGWHGLAGSTRREQQPEPHPHCHLAQAEGLDHIVVRAELQPDNAIDLIAACCQEQHGQLAGAAQLAADLEPGQIGQANVQDHQVYPTVRDAGKPLTSQETMGRGKALGGQRVDEGIGDRLLVLDDQDVARLCRHETLGLAAANLALTLLIHQDNRRIRRTQPRMAILAKLHPRWSADSNLRWSVLYADEASLTRGDVWELVQTYPCR